MILADLRQQITERIATRVSQDPTGRLRRARLTTGAMLANRGFNILTKLVVVPVSISVLGREEYGVWLVLLSMASWLTAADLGVPSALINPLAASIAQNDRTKTRQIVSTAGVLLVIAGLFVSVLGSLAVLYLPMEQLLGMSNHSRNGDVRTAALVVVVTNFGLLGLRLPEAILSGLQRGYWAAIGDATAQVLVLFCLGVLYIRGGGLTSFALAICGPPVLIDVVLLLLIAARYGIDLLPRPQYYSCSTVGLLFKDGAAFFSGAWGEMLVLQTPSFVIAQVLGAASVPLYAISYQLFYSAYGAINMLATPLWPAIAEAVASHDVQWIKTSFDRVFRESALLGIACFSGIALVAPAFVSWWAGPEYRPSYLFCIILAIHFTQWSLNYVFSVLLTGLGYIWPRVWIVVILGCFNIVLSVAFTRTGGVAGLAVAALLAMAMTQTWYLPFFARRHAAWLFIRNSTCVAAADS